jgi:enoyl-CoA hydratase
MEFQTLLYRREGRVVVVTVNRPEKLNALNHQAKADLAQCFAHIKQDPEIDVAIVTGAGEKSFVAGTDIRELTDLRSQSGKEFSATGQAIFDDIENLGKPVIAAVNGYALGGGCELALACHIRIAADNAKFGQPEVNLGVIPGYGGTQRLARLVGRGKAMEMILTGTQIDAREAHRIGLVNLVVPPDELLPRSIAMARTISSMSQVAVRMALKSINIVEEVPFGDGERLEASLFGVCCGTEDFQEGTRAFLEKRKPVFKGK